MDVPSPAKILRDESTRAKIPARSFKYSNKSLFLYLNVYVFGSGSPVEWQDIKYCNEKRAKIPCS